jgi:DnaD/phage-associated family protein
MEYKIRKLFGIGERALAPKEKAFLAKWSTEWCLPFEMIEKAYEIMVGAIAKPTFAYENGILEKWREAGCKTIEDVEGLLASQKKAPKKQETRETSFDLDEFFELAAKRGAGIAGEE